jgi:hypothetical protein
MKSHTPIKEIREIEDPDWGHAAYADPPSHDFCVWLVMAELMRRYHGVQDQLKISLVTDDHGRLLHPDRLDRVDYSDQMIPNIISPAIRMMGAVRAPDIPLNGDLGRCVMYDHHIGELVDAGKQGHDIPRWRAPLRAYHEVDTFLKGDKPLLITLREVDHQPERNSNIEAWLRFARTVMDRYRIIFVRDTAKAHEPLEGFDTCPMASMNVFIRVALMQRALCNLMVCNGPNVWAFYSHAPYLVFKELVPALAACWQHGTPQGWREQDHMEVGDQYAWAAPNQRLAWADDSYPEICAEFAKLELLL